jgi:hypothetical protein
MSGDVGQASYLVECYWPGVSAVELAAVAGRAQEAARELRRQGRELRFLSSILIPSDETIFCFFEGDEADVRLASERAGVPYERVLESVRIDGRRDRQPDERHGC